MKTRSLALLVPLAVFACDDSSSPGGSPDTSPAADTSVSNDTGPAADTAPAADTTVPNDTATTPEDTSTTPEDTGPAPDTAIPGCDRVGFAGVDASFSSEGGALLASMRTSKVSPSDTFQIEIYTYGDYHGATAPGTYSLDGSTYEDCANCVMVRAACTDEGCAKRFLVDEGDLVITQWDLMGGRFKAHLEGGAKGHEVTIDSDTYVSTLVPGGETWCLDGVEVDVEVPTLPTSDRTQASCVPEGTGTILGDNIANFSLTNCNGQRVKLHATCGDPAQKALWIIGTTGWCTACHEFLADYVARHGGALSRKTLGEQDKGLDMIIVLGEDGNGEKPTQAYCKAYAEDLKLDPAMVLMDWSDVPVDLPIVNAPDYTVQTNSLGTLWHNIDPYLRDEGGSVVTSYPWWGLLRPRNMEYVWSDRAAPLGFEVTLMGLLLEE